MIQAHGKTILSNEIQIHNQSPILIDNIKAQFSLVTLKSNSHWQYQNSILIGNIKVQFSLEQFYQKEKSSRLSTLGKEKISCYRGKKRTMAIIL